MISFDVNQQTGEKVSDKVWQKCLEAISDQLDLTTEKRLSLALIDEDEMQRLNKQYRGKDKPTDVLSFAEAEIGDKTELDSQFLGEVLIAYPIAKKQAIERGVTLDQELQRLFVHGVLHLLGYDHQEDKEAEKMESIEDMVLKNELLKA